MENMYRSYDLRLLNMWKDTLNIAAIGLYFMNILWNLIFYLSYYIWWSYIVSWRCKCSPIRLQRNSFLVFLHFISKLLGNLRMYFAITIKRYRAVKEVGQIKMSVGVIAYNQLMLVCQVSFSSSPLLVSKSIYEVHYLSVANDNLLKYKILLNGVEVFSNCKSSIL